jgi:hydrogenase expression/formation protein HypC
MCLSVPVKVIKIDNDFAEVSAGGAIFRAGLQLVEDIKEGDYVLLHAGFAIRKISDEEARKTLEIFEEIKNALNEPDNCEIY